MACVSWGVCLGFEPCYWELGEESQISAGERLGFGLGQGISSLCELGVISYDKIKMMIAYKPLEQVPGT